MSPLRGMALKLSAVFLFVIMASLIKASSDVVPPGEAVFFRSFFALPVILGWLTLRRELSTGLRTRNPSGHFWRGLFGVSAMAWRLCRTGVVAAARGDGAGLCRTDPDGVVRGISAG